MTDELHEDLTVGTSDGGVEPKSSPGDLLSGSFAEDADDAEDARFKAAHAEIVAKHPEWKLFRVKIANGGTFIAKLLPLKTITRFGQELDKPNADVAALMSELVRRAVVWPREKVSEEYLNDPNKTKPGHIIKLGDAIMSASGFKDEAEVKAL